MLLCHTNLRIGDLGKSRASPKKTKAKALTAGLAGRLLKEASGATSILTRSAGEAGTQVDGGAGGEVVAQALTGEYEFNPLENQTGRLAGRNPRDAGVMIAWSGVGQRKAPPQLWGTRAGLPRPMSNAVINRPHPIPSPAAQKEAPPLAGSGRG